MVRHSFVLLASLPLAASAAEYTQTTAEKFESGATCQGNKLPSDTVCADNADGKSQCDTAAGCNAFIRNSVEGKCYLYDMPTCLLKPVDEGGCIDVGDANHT